LIFGVNTQVFKETSRNCDYSSTSEITTNSNNNFCNIQLNPVSYRSPMATVDLAMGGMFPGLMQNLFAYFSRRDDWKG